jgi:putative membrane protein
VASASTAYLHYVAMISMATLLALELMVCMSGLSAERVRVLVRLHYIYFGACLIALGSGLAYLIWFGKGAAFYLHNPVFYIKLALFAALGLISMPPTLQYRRWLRSFETAPYSVADSQVVRMRSYIGAELVLVAAIPLMATFVARGVGIQAAAQ